MRQNTKYNISLIRSEFSALLCAPLRLNFHPQCATILPKAVLGILRIEANHLPRGISTDGTPKQIRN
jgi:hypothetical protein